MNINRMSDTPLVKDSPYLIDWTHKGILGKGSLGTVRKASSRVTNEVVASTPGIFRRSWVLQTLRHVRINCIIQSSYLILIQEIYYCV
jgi:hypothetical protein